MKLTDKFILQAANKQKSSNKQQLKPLTSERILGRAGPFVAWPGPRAAPDSRG